MKSINIYFLIISGIILISCHKINLLKKSEGIEGNVTLQSKILEKDFNETRNLLDKGHELKISENEKRELILYNYQQMPVDVFERLLNQLNDYEEIYSNGETYCTTIADSSNIIHHLLEGSGEEPFRRFDLLEAIIPKLRNINLVDSENQTYLDYACFLNNQKTAEILLENGAEIERENHSSLIESSKYSNYEITSLLIREGANVNFKDEYGDTPLHVTYLCCSDGHFEGNNEKRIKQIKLLLDNGAEANISNNDNVTFTDLISNGHKKDLNNLIKSSILTSK